MASYYYLISSLPDLTSDGKIPLSFDEFIAACSGCVSDEKLEALKNPDKASCSVAVSKKWAKFYGDLTAELNLQRSTRLGKSYSSDYDKDSLTAGVVASALNAKNPLEAEKILLDYEFENLDNMVGLHTFDDEYLFGYAIKLKLLQRLSCFTQKKGQEEFGRLLSGVQKSVCSL